MDRHYADMIDVQMRLRAVVDSAGLSVTLEPDPGQPVNTDQLAEALDVIRTNLNRVQAHLDGWDHHLNGCETRTRPQIEQDIQLDTRALSRPDLREDRTVADIAGYIAYDEMQLRRN